MPMSFTHIYYLQIIDNSTNKLVMLMSTNVENIPDADLDVTNKTFAQVVAEAREQCYLDDLPLIIL